MMKLEDLCLITERSDLNDRKCQHSLWESQQFLQGQTGNTGILWALIPEWNCVAHAFLYIWETFYFGAYFVDSHNGSFAYDVHHLGWRFWDTLNKIKHFYKKILGVLKISLSNKRTIPKHLAYIMQKLSKTGNESEIVCCSY